MHMYIFPGDYAYYKMWMDVFPEMDAAFRLLGIPVYHVELSMVHGQFKAISRINFSPTITLFKNRVLVSQYRGTRHAVAIVRFFERSVFNCICSFSFSLSLSYACP